MLFNFPSASYLDERMLTYEPIVLFVSCAFIKIWSPCKVLRVLKKLEMLSAAPRATLTRIICSPNFPRAGVKLDQFPDLIYWRPLVGRKQRRRFKRRKQLERFNFFNISFFKLVAEYLLHSLKRKLLLRGSKSCRQVSHSSIHSEGKWPVSTVQKFDPVRRKAW